LEIVFAVTNDLSYDQRMQRICSSLAGAGYTVTLVGRKRKDSVPLRHQPYRQERLTCLFDKGFLFYAEFNLRLFYYLLKKKANAISAVDLDTLMPCALVATIKNTKLFFDAHEHFTEVPEVADRKTVKAVWEWIGQTFIHRAHMAYTVGEALAGVLSAQYHQVFGVIKNVPLLQPPATFDHNNGQHTKVLLYQGALNEARGLEACILAMHEIHGAELHLAGEGDLSDQLRQMVANENLQDKVKFLGRVEPAELKKITAGAFCGLNLLQPNGLSYYYSLANKFFDYIHAGIPCICADFPEYRNIVARFSCAVLCDAEPGKIAGAVNALLNDRWQYEGLKRHCTEAAKVFNWQLEEVKLLELYGKELKTQTER
jgi:glycosyltransferase involved in cell wall biosynthesis